MINKNLLTLTLTALSVLTCNTSFATATATSHKTWGVPEIKFTINQNKAPASYNPYHAKKKRNEIANNYLAASTKITSLDISSDDGITVTAQADASQFLGNFGIAPQTYTVTHTVCTLQKQGDIYTNERCSNSSSDYMIAPGDSTFSTNNASMRWAGAEPGDYLVAFSTSIQNTQGDTIFYSYDYLPLNITAAK